MHPFEQLIYDRLVQGIRALTADTYALAFQFDSYWSADAAGLGVSIQAAISLWYNTHANYEAQIASASSPDEAKWNTAFWLSDTAVSIPRSFDYGTEPPLDELALRDAWCASLGILPSGTDDGGRPEYSGLNDAVREALQKVAQKLHNDGVLVSKFGKPIPIIIEEHDNSLVNAKATQAANPPGLSRAAEEWLLGRTYAQIEAYEALLHEVQSRSALEQAIFWREVLLDFEMNRPSAARQQLLSMARTKYDVRRALAGVGPAAVPILIPVIEEYADQEQYRIRNPHPILRDGEWTPASEVTMAALNAIREIGSADDTAVERLTAVLKALYRDSISKDWIGTNLSGVASTLHALRPQRFPQPRIGSRDNKLINFADFGLSDNPAE